MFSRRLLRIKVLQTLYSYHKVDGKTYASSERDLLHSLEKSYELYHLLMLLIIDVIDFAESKIEQASQKRIQTPEDLNPNTRFIDNALVKQLRNNEGFKKFLTKTHISWVQSPEIVRNLYLLILDTELYQEYMSAEDHTYMSDKRFLERVLFNLVMNYEDLYLNLEEQSIFWIDDVDFIIKMIVKTFKKFSAENLQGTELLPMLKEKDDLSYCKKLLRTTIKNEAEYLELIKASANNWELERIAFTDSLILQLAISEAIEFKSIPIKVTINEFIEIAKLYSTQKSSQFINGILDNIFTGLKAEGKIVKTGRGLIGEV
ncbi:transcription antitermination factor NusB [Bacteroidota bacterium]